MKKFVLSVVIAFIACPLIVLGQTALGIGGKTGHVDMVTGLKQFPAKYPTPRGSVRATVVGFGVGNPVIEDGVIYRTRHLDLATEDGQSLNILVVSPEIELALFMHEVHPNTGKYAAWYPVLEFKGKHNDWVYSWYEIDVVGRFRMETDKDYKVVGYQNEVYR